MPHPQQLDSENKSTTSAEQSAARPAMFRPGFAAEHQTEIGEIETGNSKSNAEKKAAFSSSEAARESDKSAGGAQPATTRKGEGSRQSGNAYT
eukprot:tig00020961_g16765.t1